MEKSFTSWRAEPEPCDTSDTDDSDVVQSSSGNLYVPDSDESIIVNKPTSKVISKANISVIPDSDEEQSYLFAGSTSTPKLLASDIFSKSTDSGTPHSIFNKSTESPNTSSASEASVKPTPLKKRHNVIEDSDEEDISTQCGVQQNLSNECGALNVFSSSAISTSDRLSNASNKTEAVIDLTLSNTSSEISKKSHNINLSNASNKVETVIDLTSRNTSRRISNTSDHSHRSINTSSHRSINTSSHRSINTSNIIKIDSDSESNNFGTTNEIKPSLSSVHTQERKKTDNDLSSRAESLRAEESKLRFQVAEVMKDIETTKNTVKTANLAALPDKGVRLQMFLKKKENQLRDLRYQQSTLSNELIKLQLMPKSSNSQAPKPASNKSGQQIYKLPTMTTDINAMGKKALETHRVHQSLTVDALRSLHNSLKNRPSEETLESDPRYLYVDLMPHQKHALAWLLWREAEKPYGGILADDMGLGKTLTMISLILKSNEARADHEDEDSDSEDSVQEKHSNWLSSERAKLVQGNTLVVCPATLLGQWEGEVDKRLKSGVLKVLVHHGQDREKKARRLARPDLVITTYNIVGRDAEQEQSPLFQIRWGRIILDEAHQIRNYKTKMAQGVFKLKGRNRWALTGTPVHNKELDLYSLIRFLRCKPFDDLLVWKRWVDNRDAAGQQRLSTIMNAIMLRRTKEGLQTKGELKSLTGKEFHSIRVTLDKDEQEAYEKLLLFSKTLFATFLHQKAEKENALTGIPVSSNPRKYLGSAENPFEKHPHLARLHQQMKNLNDIKTHHILVLLLRMRQFCVHPALIKAMLEKEDLDGGIEEDGLDLDMMDKLTRMSIAPEDKENCGNNSADVESPLSSDNPLFLEDRISSKLKKILETMKEILNNGDDKIIIVSQWTSLLNVLEGILKSRHIKSVKLTGAVAIKDRAYIVDKFNLKGRGPRILLLSLTAGGVGLNLVGGNHLILVDLHWNPQLESQACDRIYRVGQEKTCQIYKFIASDTIEENIMQLQEKKLQIAEGVLTGGKHSSKLSLDDLKMLFSLQ